jgi:hypothetical protein
VVAVMTCGVAVPGRVAAAQTWPAVTTCWPCCFNNEVLRQVLRQVLLQVVVEAPAMGPWGVWARAWALVCKTDGEATPDHTTCLLRNCRSPLQGVNCIQGGWLLLQVLVLALCRGQLSLWRLGQPPPPPCPFCPRATDSLSQMYPLHGVCF